MGMIPSFKYKHNKAFLLRVQQQKMQSWAPLKQEKIFISSGCCQYSHGWFRCSEASCWQYSFSLEQVITITGAIQSQVDIVIHAVVEKNLLFEYIPQSIPMDW